MLRNAPRAPRPRALVALLPLTAIFAISTPAIGAPEEGQAFHLTQVSKLLVGYNGDVDIQAVEIDFITAGENFFSGVSVVAYDSIGTVLGTLGTFGATLPNGLATDFALCATAKFRDTFGIQPDLIITPGILPRTGQIGYRTAACLINSVAYGNSSVPVTGTGAAPILYPDLAYALVRTVSNGTLTSCPLAENSAARFEVKSGSAASPITFTNNARQTVTVFSTLTGTEITPPAAPAVRVSPNPFARSTRIEAPDWGPLTVHDVRGRLVRVLTCIPGGACPARAGKFAGTWDGTDRDGNRVPSGIYLLRYQGEAGTVVRRMAVVR
jgi:hypothetical protein